MEEKCEMWAKMDKNNCCSLWAASSQQYFNARSSLFNKGSLFTCDFQSPWSRWSIHVLDPHSWLCCNIWYEVRNSNLEIRGKVRKLPTSSFWEKDIYFNTKFSQLQGSAIFSHVTVTLYTIMHHSLILDFDFQYCWALWKHLWLNIYTGNLRLCFSWHDS